MHIRRNIIIYFSLLCSSLLLTTDNQMTDDHIDIHQLALGETLQLKELGPIIVNMDGTTRRITNWKTMSAQEQESSWRLISARNKKRMEKLKDKVVLVKQNDKNVVNEEVLAIGDGSENDV